MPNLPNADIILLIILGGFVLYGFWFGLIHALGGLVGVVVGSILATRLYAPVAGWAMSIFGGNQNVMRILAFSILFVLVTRLVGFLFYLAEKLFGFISVIPFMKTINRLAGAILGFIEGAFVVGGIIFVMAFLPIPGRTEASLRSSRVAAYLVRTYRVMQPFLPRALRDFDPSTYFRIPPAPPPPALP